ncbi:MFS transporter [Aquibacillus sp. 3ASR75-11]|uniref:MFS transporter n=1 Tax=Terrihalobacillus insolitus TaxID=2950438 RepID=A0A9X3WVK0_9BACI|nr:MDR family MFS transporter [Terrihalobacillus insolitus]MDC3414024.1 MFS transporter [Terrihalobacillus insolitus]MDC3424114.1 MFS transporter [Terrihalobacillus insolitus]
MVHTRLETKKTNRPLVLAAVILGMFMAAIEATIVSTATPSIVADVGGFSLFTWVFSAFLLMQAVTIPIYGKLADLFGRKSIFTIGVIIFLIGSILCGFVKTMPMLIVFRSIQGIGAGAVQPIATTIVGDIYTKEERAKIQGYLASVWGISSVAGPMLGALFVQYLYWGWVFWINVPIGILAIIGIVNYLHEDIEQKKHNIDYLGSSLLFISVSSLMILLIQGGVSWSWISSPSLGLMALFLITFVFFFWQETRASEPMMPLGIWKNRIIAVANIGSLTTGAIMIGVSTFLPTFVQGVMERSPIVAGITLGMMSIGWPISSTIAGRLMIKIGYLRTAIIGGINLIIGSIFFITLTPKLGPVWAGVGSFFIGSGMGFATTTFIVSIQSSVEWKVRGVATASNMFMRILGNTIGASLMGAILNTRLQAFLDQKTDALDISVDVNVTNSILDPESRRILGEETVKLIQEGLTLSLQSVYWSLLVLAIISLIIITFLPHFERNTKSGVKKMKKFKKGN